MPEIDGVALRWRVCGPPERMLAAELVLSWYEVQARHPGRLRPCGNAECRLFHLDRSRANTARWCSMKTCGNRLKARRHQERARHRPTS
ncbi:CGNR zinc finger domain-containing protein [Micromonospora sp. DT229]|uniref:CGNR zinc finger domain-containing protein n=1 Tax=Micromonospora sp. DT229 TaxID=3393430 RepID=UPI003CF03163